MIKVDEITFLMLMQQRCRAEGADTGESPRDIIATSAHILAEKRAHALLRKWQKKGWYDYGTVIDGGWLTEAGLTASLEKEWKRQQKIA